MCRYSAWKLLPAVLLPMLVAVGGCRRPEAAGQPAGVRLEFVVAPTPPAAGAETAAVTLTDADGRPIRGAVVRLEGDMNHPGMTPVFAEAAEKGPGRYEATLNLTMGGDWFVLIDAALADGRTLHKKVDLPGVKSR